MTRFAIPRKLRGTLGVVSLVVLSACAAQENDTTPTACNNPKSVACSHTGGTSSSGGTGDTAGNSAVAGTDSGVSGSTSSGGTGGTSDPTAGAGATSTAGSSASGGAAGTSAVAGAGGMAAGGTAAGGAPAGGAPGTGGGGATGTAGTVGAGGATGAACTTAIPARSSWLGTASNFSKGCTGTDGMAGPLCNPPAYAIDASVTTRFSTGKPQAGTEWLEIDLTTKGTVDQVTVSVSNGDFGRHLQIRMSDTDQDTAAAVLAEMDGVTGLMTFKFAAKTARYILISQTKPLATGETSWWSVQDVTATCN